MFISSKKYVKYKMWILLYIMCIYQFFFHGEQFLVTVSDGNYIFLMKLSEYLFTFASEGEDWFSFQNIASFSECVRNSLTLTVMYHHQNETVLESPYNNYYLNMFINAFQELHIVRSQWWGIWTLGAHCRSSWIWW